MAQNDLKPHHSSSEEDEEEEEEEASGSEDEQTSGSETDEVSDSASDEKPNPPEPTKPIIAPPKSAIKPQAPDSSESGTEESGSSDTDSDSPPKKSPVADPKIKPISSKPMDREAPSLDSKVAKKSGSKTSSTPPPTSKRPSVAPAASEKDPKKSRTNTAAADDDSKKQLFQRLWSEDDEIVILKGMIDYKSETGENPIADTAAFHEFIKKSLHVDVSRAQLVDKIRRLRKKFVNNASREKNGKDRSFSKSHEQKGYELSKLIWGGSGHSSGAESKKAKSQNQKNGNGASTSGGTAATTLLKSNGLDEKEVALMEVEKNMDISRFVRYGGRDDSPVLTEEIVKAGMELVEGSKRVELEDKWKSLKKQELELYLKKMELIKEQALVVLEAVNSSGN
ncbi:hypothetical protein SSX86_023122 [Deinandra increscens subsp. villosa]|uniref:Glabrous enhancer-binding protein-like DBD domain-containing protein n=1 Tax=Deinandra increscens subsp. villosa TaxID=3103831 RepID=A0AAP0CQF9_9ASTR